MKQEGEEERMRKEPPPLSCHVQQREIQPWQPASKRDTVVTPEEGIGRVALQEGRRHSSLIRSYGLFTMFLQHI